MAISLQNHETRIAALEARPTSSAKFWVIPNGTKTIDLNNYDADVFIFIGGTDGSCSVYGSANLISGFITDKSITGTVAIHHMADQYYSRGINLAGNKVSFTQTNGSTATNVGAMIGLKLYYNFSYNIIREFLSKIKIKLKSYLGTLPITRR